MAFLIAKADGNLTDAATWALVDPTSQSTGSTGVVGTTTSYVASNTFTPGAITIDGIAVRIQGRGPGGTFSVALDQAGATVAGTEVTVNLTDIPSFSAPALSDWQFFKFASPVTLLAATAYAVKVKSSVTSAVNLYVSTSVFYDRLLRTTTSQAPAAGDRLYIFGEKTGAGTMTPRAVTMNDAAAGATVYGQIEVAGGGTLAYGTAGATNYYLKLAGDLNVFPGGTLNMGTSGTPMPADSSAVLEFNCSSNVQFGLNVKEGATANMRGNAIANVKAKLAANATASAVTLTTDISTGWKSGDLIGIAPTSRTYTEAESRTLGSDAVGTSLSVPALTNAHDGTGSVQAELINLTRNVKVRGISTTLQAYVNVAGTAVWNSRYVEFYQLGSGTNGKRSIDVATTTGSFDMQYCSVHDGVVSGSRGVSFTGATLNNIICSHNVLYGLDNTVVLVPATTGTSIVIDDNVAVKCVTNSTIFNIADVGITFTNNVAAGGAGVGIVITEAAVVTGTYSGNVTHSNAGGGGMVQNLLGGTISNTLAWRNNSAGFLVQGCKNVTVDGVVAFGNSNISYNYGFNSVASFNVVSKNIVCDAGVTLTCPLGVSFDFACGELFFENCSFGASQPHATGDVGIGTANLFLTATFSNCLFGSSTEVASLSNLLTGSYIRSAKHDGVQDSHKTWLPEGTIQIDTTLGDPATPSSRLTPSSSSSKLKSARKQVPCASGQQVTVSIEVRKSVVGDGTAYNGSQPRLVVEKNVAAGLAADTVLATAAAAAGQWETLTAQLPAPTDDCVYTIFVDCDGTAGWVNIDHIRLTNPAANASGTMKYWRDGLPFNGIDPGGRSGVDFLYWLEGLPSSLLFPFPGAAVAGITAGEAEGAATAAALPSAAAVAGVSSGEAAGAAALVPGALLASAGGIFSAEAEGVGALLQGVSLAVVAGIASDEGEGAPSASPPLLRKTPLLAKLLSANRRRALIR